MSKKTKSVKHSRRDFLLKGMVAIGVPRHSPRLAVPARWQNRTPSQRQRQQLKRPRDTRKRRTFASTTKGPDSKK